MITSTVQNIKRITNIPAVQSGAAGIIGGITTSLFAPSSMNPKKFALCMVFGSRILGAVAGLVVPPHYKGQAGALVGGALSAWCAAGTYQFIRSHAKFDYTDPSSYLAVGGCLTAMTVMTLVGTYHGYCSATGQHFNVPAPRPAHAHQN